MFFRLLISFIPALLLAAPTAPSDLTLTSTSNTVSLSWQDNSAAENGFKIFRDGVLVHVVGSSVTSYVDNALNASTRYSYIVKATDDDINKPIIGIAEDYTLRDENLQVSLLGTLSGDRDWVAIYPAGDSNDGGNIIAWGYVSPGINTLSHIEKDMPVGEYEARLFFHDSYNLEASTAFSVRDENGDLDYLFQDLNIDSNESGQVDPYNRTL